ncbi:MAG: phosphocholine cytidylyltransferase family protein [Magnetococcales bacterium]|nr:phosphocholine cytidylyltransferase family protein [Magnetococcales bacterium]
MNAIILAAGRGSRMQNLTQDRPKCLVEYRGRQLVDWQLQALRQAGIARIALVTGYLREKLEALGLPTFYNPHWSRTNMVSSLVCADAWLREAPCVVSYSDIFYESNAVELLMNCPADLAVTYDPNWRVLWEQRFDDPLLDAETFRLNSDNSLAEIGNRPNHINEVQGQYMGLLRFTPVGWSELLRVLEGLCEEDRNKIHATGVLQKIIEAGRIPVTAIPYTGVWGEIDSLNDLLVMSDYYQSIKE